MANLENAVSELSEMDDLAAGTSCIHRLHPLAKLFMTIAYALITVSFPKYDFSGLAFMILFPLVLFSLSGISVGTCFRKLRIVLPLVLAVGIANPFLDSTVFAVLGGFKITGGMISMVTLMMKGVFCLMASFILAATTEMDALCACLVDIHVPSMIVTMLLLTYRYVSVMTEEVGNMNTAYKLRAPMQKGIHISAWGSFLGQLLLRSMDRAEELYSGMVLRGFDGSFTYAKRSRIRLMDFAAAAAVILLMVLCRTFNVTEILGRIAMGGFR